SVQGLLPRTIVNGWTGERALGTSWHRFLNNQACLACLYHPTGPGPSATEQAARALGLSTERATVLWLTRQPLSSDDLRVIATTLEVPREQIDGWANKTLGELYTDVVCGAAPIGLKGVGRVEVVPLAHQSALAGILMAAELVKRTDSQFNSRSQPEPLVSWDDVLRPLPSIWTKPRSKEPGCICGDEIYSAAYAAKW